MANEKPRLIDANDAVKLLRGKCVAKYPNSFLLGLLAAATEIEQSPTVDAVEVVHGRWLSVEGSLFPGQKEKCSLCGVRKGIGYVYHYCPNCGAKMDLEETE